MASAAAAKKWPRPSQCRASSASDQPEVGLVDQGGGLERLAGLLLRQPLGGELAQLVVDQRQESLGGLRVALLDGARMRVTSATTPSIRRRSESRDRKPATRTSLPSPASSDAQHAAIRRRRRNRRIREPGRLAGRRAGFDPPGEADGVTGAAVSGGMKSPGRGAGRIWRRTPGKWVNRGGSCWAVAFRARRRLCRNVINHCDSRTSPITHI